MTLQIPWLEHASRRRRWLVGVSGGADSVALLHLLVRAGFRRLVVCHLDHRLRGRASTADGRFVQRLAESLGLPCELRRVDVAELARQRGESVETAARHARHAMFAEIARSHRCHRVLLAHHADDQAETVLWNLMRGSHGIKGMRAVQPLVVSDGTPLELHRPLLALHRDALRDWLRENRLKWREDTSNAEPVAVRNRLRHEVLPLLAEIAGRDATARLAQAAADDAAAREITDWALDQARVLDPQGRLHLPTLRELPESLQRAAIHAYLRDHGVPGLDRALVGRALDLLDRTRPAVANLPGGRVLRRGGGRMWVADVRNPL